MNWGAFGTSTAQPPQIPWEWQRDRELQHMRQQLQTWFLNPAAITWSQ